MEYIKELHLDVSGGESYACVTAKQFDKKARYIKIILYDNSKKYVFPDDAEVKLRARKPDGNSVLNDADVDSDKSIIVELTEQLLAVAGNVKAELSLYGSDGAVLTSCTFYIIVVPTVCDFKNIESTYEYNSLNSALQSVSSAVDSAQSASKNAADIAQALVKAKENGEFNGAQGPQGEKGEKGEQGLPGNDGADGRGTETIVVTTEDELVAAMEKITAEFTVGTVASVIGTGTLLGLQSPFSDVDLSGLAAERIIIDRGSGSIREAIVLNNYVNTTTLIQSISRNIQLLKEQADTNAQKNVINHYTDLQKAYDAASTGIAFSDSPKRIRVIITLPASDVPVKINIGQLIDLADSISEGSELCFQADLFAKNAISYSYTLSDADKNVVKTANMLKRSSIAKISRFALKGYEAGKTFTAVYVGAGN